MEEEKLEALNASKVEGAWQKGYNHPLHGNFTLGRASQHLNPKFDEILPYPHHSSNPRQLQLIT